MAFSYKDNGADVTVDLSPTLRAGNHDKIHANSGQPPAICIQHATIGRRDEAGLQGKGYQIDMAFTQDSRASSDVVQHGLQVRRLIPVKCERLQGFPDNHTLIPLVAPYGRKKSKRIMLNTSCVAVNLVLKIAFGPPLMVRVTAPLVIAWLFLSCAGSESAFTSSLMGDRNGPLSESSQNSAWPRVPASCARCM